MIIISGVRLAGKVDAIPHLGHVATRFFHLYYVPLIPLGSYLVTGDGTDEVPGVALPLNTKSLVVGWLRSLAWVSLIGGGALVVLGLANHRPPRVVVGFCMTAIAAALLVPLYRWRTITSASYDRAVELGRQARLSPEKMLMLEVAYGRLTADEAERELKQVYESTR